MTGPEHYREAEKLLGYAEARDAEQRGDAEDISFLAEAQVHATLALFAKSEAAAIPDGKVLVDRCAVCESANGRQCLKGEYHQAGHDFGDGDAG
ncbi:hypothetical protein ACWGLE_01350 [Streptomyces sp. NPDC055897]